MESLELLQLQLEADAVEQGLARYRSEQGKRSSENTKLGLDFIRSLIAPLAEAIKTEQQTITSGKSKSKLPKYAVPLVSLDAEKLALITLRSMFSVIVFSQSAEDLPTLLQIAHSVGRRCRLERQLDVLRERERDVFHLLVERNKNPWNARRRALALARTLDEDDWSEDYKDIHLGAALVRLAVGSTQAFEKDQVMSGAGGKLKTISVIRFSKATEVWLSKKAFHLESLAVPLYQPMVIPPLPWTDIHGGGYLTNRETRLFSLVKHKGSKRSLELLKESDLSRVFTAVNAIQETPWRVNSHVLNVVRRAQEVGLGLPGFPGWEAEENYQRFAEDAGLDKADRARAYRSRSKLVGDREVFRMRLEACGHYEKRDRFYLPHQLDTRGRAYPLPQILNYQADDMGKAILEFADGKPLGEHGEHWLAIHAANKYGIDKVSFADRLSWFRQNEGEIIALAESPLERKDFWARADKPWCFLAAALEWRAFRLEGSGFLSRIPVAMDGTCNGLQHLSAMGRDLDGGRATNLVPNDRPSDIYREVAERVSARVDLDASAGIAIARGWQGRISRDLVKRATMTTPYGVTSTGIRDQLIEDRFADHLEDKWGGVSYLTRILEASISEVVVAAHDIMRWLKGMALTLAKANRGMVWTVPTGFKVYQESLQTKASRIVTADFTLQVLKDDPKRRIDVRKQTSAVAPNFVHSMDAAHMMLTVENLRNNGLRHFAMVHDSYAVHACDLDMLNEVLRREFVSMYKQPILTLLYQELSAANPKIAFGPPPQVGDLDISLVLDSRYFFA